MEIFRYYKNTMISELVGKGRDYDNLAFFPNKIFSDRATWIGYKGRVMRILMSGFIDDSVRLSISTFFPEVLMAELVLTLPSSRTDWRVIPYIPDSEEIKWEIGNHLEALFLQPVNAYK